MTFYYKHVDSRPLGIKVPVMPETPQWDDVL